MNLNIIGVIGAGTMGNGIAQACAMAGYTVLLHDIDEGRVQRGLDTIASNLQRMVMKEKITPAGKDQALALIRGVTSLEALAEAGLVIEAATERLELKLRLLRDVDAVLGPEAILASNTSSISITQLAAVTGRPDRFIGMHFFNPVPMMGLVELIRGLQTSDATHAQVAALVARMGKAAVTVRNSPGFVVNRILCPMLNEAIFVLAEGLACANDIDAGMRLGCNHPIGPLALADMIGLDTLLAVLDVFHAEFCDSKYRPAPLLREYVAGGFLGRKSGRGFYHYA